MFIITDNSPELEQVVSSISDKAEKFNDFEISGLGDAEELEVNDLSEEDEKKIKSKLVFNLVKLVEIEMKTIDFDYESVMKKVNKLKIEEKDDITDYLKQMTDEEREIENLFKNNKLEQWSVGLQKGLVTYDKETYDREMTRYEEKIMNSGGDAEMLETIEKEREADAIEEQEYNMANLADDDEYGEGRDGDEHW